MEEIWKDIIDYEGIYQVSSSGKVKNLKTNRILKPSNRLYSDVDLSKNGEYHRQAIHRLVALHFIPNPNPKVLTEVNHKDGNKKNNCIENLEWVTTKQNKMHSIEVLNHHPFGKEARKVLKIDLSNGKVIEEYSSLSDAARGIGTIAARSSITNVCQGYQNSAYGFKWQYADK